MSRQEKGALDFVMGWGKHWSDSLDSKYTENNKIFSLIFSSK